MRPRGEASSSRGTRAASSWFLLKYTRALNNSRGAFQLVRPGLRARARELMLRVVWGCRACDASDARRRVSCALVSTSSGSEGGCFFFLVELAILQTRIGKRGGSARTYAEENS